MDDIQRNGCHSAEDAALGFYYQIFFALLTLLEQNTDDAAVGIEQLANVLSRFQDAHLSLAEDPPEPRSVQLRESGAIVVVAQVGGLHHRYERRAADAALLDAISIPQQVCRFPPPTAPDFFSAHQ